METDVDLLIRDDFFQIAVSMSGCSPIFDNPLIVQYQEIEYNYMTGLSSLETRFFGYVQSRSRSQVETGELVAALRIDPSQEHKLLSRLARRKLIARVRRGLYLVPPRIPPGGTWNPSEALALTTLMDDKRARYQISGPNAFSRYGWDEQIPNRTFVYNNRLSGNRTIGANQFTLIKVADERLGSIEIVNTPEGIDLVYASRPRALMDAVYNWSRFNTLPRAFDWMKVELENDGSLASEIVAVTLAYGNQGTLRRIGRLLEMADAPRPFLRRLERALRPTTSYVPWIPTRPKQGHIDKRWMLLVNDD